MRIFKHFESRMGISEIKCYSSILNFLCLVSTLKMAIGKSRPHVYHELKYAVKFQK